MIVRDVALLDRWIQQRDAEAFSEIVRRHSPMVYWTCVRILRNEAEAEDVTQDCFLRLLRFCDEGKHIRSSVGGWLHAAATHGALARLRSEARRSARDRRFSEAAGAGSEPPDLDDVQRHVDEAIEELPPKLQEPVVSHFLSGMTHKEIADAMGLPRRTVTSRVARGVDEVRKSLNRRGIPLTTSALASIFTIETAGAAPRAVVASLSKLALSEGAAATHGSKGAAAIQIAGPSTSGAVVSSTAKAVAVAASLGLAVLALIVLRNGGEPEASVRAVPAVSSVATAAARDAAVESPRNAAQRVLPEPSAAEPARAGIRVAQQTPIEPPQPLAEPRATEEPGAPTSSISGLAITQDGRPVAGASVVVAFSKDTDPDLPSNPQRALGRPQNQYRAVTDGEGRFQISEIMHEGWARIFVEADGMQGASGADVESGDSVEDLEVVLYQGVQLLGRILSPDGAPVPGAYVRVLASSPKYAEDLRMDFTICDDSGYFQLIFSRPTSAHLLVHSVAGDALFEAVRTGRDGVAELRLPRPGAVAGRVLSASGEPAHGVAVVVKSPARVQYGQTPNPVVHGTGLQYAAVTDEAGRYEISGIYPDSTYQVSVRTAGDKEIFPKHDLARILSGETLRQDISIPPLVHITGAVMATNRPGPVGNVGVALLPESDPGSGPDKALSTMVDDEGRFDLQVTVDPGRYVLTPYYEHVDVSLTSEVFGRTLDLESGTAAEVDLKIDPPFAATLSVRDAAGQPVPDVYISIEWRHQDRARMYAANWQPDAQGRFSWNGFAPYGEYVLHAVGRGYVSAETGTFTGKPGAVVDLGTIILYRASGIRGVAVDESGKALGNTWVTLKASAAGTDIHTTTLKTRRDGSFATEEDFPAANVYVRASVRDGELTWTSELTEFPPDAILDFGEIVFEKSE